MAKLNNSQVNGDLSTTDLIAQTGMKIDKKYIATVEISGYTLIFKAADGTELGRCTLPQ